MASRITVTEFVFLDADRDRVPKLMNQRQQRQPEHAERRLRSRPEWSWHAATSLVSAATGRRR